MDILITILIAVIVMGIFYYIVTLIPLPAPFKNVALAICALIFLIWLLNIVGIWGPSWHVRLDGR